MATAAQIEANRINAKCSCGPRTETGKARNSRRTTRSNLASPAKASSSPKPRPGAVRDCTFLWGLFYRILTDEERWSSDAPGRPRNRPDRPLRGRRDRIIRIQRGSSRSRSVGTTTAKRKWPSCSSPSSQTSPGSSRSSFSARHKAASFWPATGKASPPCSNLARPGTVRPAHSPATSSASTSRSARPAQESTRSPAKRRSNISAAWRWPRSSVCARFKRTCSTSSTA